MKILFADDDQKFRDSMVEFLERRGYSVVPAPDGRTAISFVEKEQFDLIITPTHICR